MKMNKLQKRKWLKHLKSEYTNCFLNTSIDHIMFDIVVKDYFYHKEYKPRGNFEDAMFLCEVFHKFGISGWNSPFLLKKHHSERFMKLLVAVKASIQFERYDLTIRINKILITYFPNPNFTT